MKLMTRNTDYAIRAVCSMAARPKGLVTVNELVKELKIPRPFLRKILQRLNRALIVRSTRGLGGGFRLSMNAYSVTLADLIEVFQGPLSINECTFKKRRCLNVAKCPIKRKIDEIERHVETELRSTSIGDLLNKG